MGAGVALDDLPKQRGVESVVVVLLLRLHSVLFAGLAVCCGGVGEQGGWRVAGVGVLLLGSKVGGVGSSAKRHSIIFKHNAVASLPPSTSPCLPFVSVCKLPRRLSVSQRLGLLLQVHLRGGVRPFLQAQRHRQRSTE